MSVNRTLEITGSFSGSQSLTVAAGPTAPANSVAGPPAVPAQSAGKIVLKSDNSGYTGTITVGSNSWLDLDHDNAVAGADVIVTDGSMVRRQDADASGTTSAQSWALTGRDKVTGNDSYRGAIFYNYNGLIANLTGGISISGAATRIGEYSAESTLRATNSNLAGWLGDAAKPLTVNLKAGGISIDSNGFDIRAISPILADLVSTGGGLTKITSFPALTNPADRLPGADGCL